MALPVTIGSGPITPHINGYVGPFKSSEGAFYTILQTVAAIAARSAWKAIDPTDSFAEQDTGSRPNTAATGIHSWWVFQKGDILHCADQGATGDDVYYFQFDMFDDTWTDLPSVPQVLVANNASEAQATACSIAVEETGSDIVITYQGNPSQNKDMGSEFDWIAYTKSEDGGETWSNGNVVADVTSASEVDFTGCVIVPGSADRMHIFFEDDGNLELYQRTLKSDDTLETFPSSFETDPEIPMYAFGVGISYDDAGTQKIRCPFKKNIQSPTSDVGAVATLDSSDAPTVSVTDSATDNVVKSNSLVPVISMAVDGTDEHILYADFTDSDIYHTTNDGGGWDTDTEVLDAVTANHISSNIYDRSGTKLAIIYDDGEVIKYTEVDISGVSGVTILPPLGMIAISGQIPVVGAGKNLVPPLGTISISDLIPQVGTSVAVIAPLDTIVITDPVPVISINTIILPPLGIISISNIAPIVASGAGINTPLGTISISDLIPILASGVLVSVVLDAISIGDLVPDISINTNVNIPTGSISISNLVPTLETGVAVVPPVGIISIGDLIPVVSIGIVVSMPLGTISISDLVPIILTGVNISIPLGTITISDLIPSIDIIISPNIAVPLDVVSISNPIPIIASGVHITIPIDELTISDLIPFINSKGVPIAAFVEIGEQTSARWDNIPAGVNL